MKFAQSLQWQSIFLWVLPLLQSSEMNSKHIANNCNANCSRSVVEMLSDEKAMYDKRWTWAEVNYFLSYSIWNESYCVNILRAYTRNLFVCLCQRNARTEDKANTFLFYKSDGRRYHTDFSGKIVVFRLQTKPNQQRLRTTSIIISTVPVCTPHSSLVSISHFKPVLSYVKQMTVVSIVGWLLFFLFCF